MLGIILALLSSVMYTVSTILSRRRLDKTNPFSISLMTIIVGNISIWPFAMLFVNFEKINLESTFLFAIAGILAPGLARFFYYEGMKAVGASVNACIFATNPMYTSLLAVFLLNEDLSLANLIGIILIIMGVIFIEKNMNGNKRADVGKRIIKSSLIFTLISTSVTAFSQIIRKQGLSVLNEPLFGLAIGTSASLFFYVFRLLTVEGYWPSSKDIRLLWKPSLSLNLALILSFYALSYEKVSIVTPLIQIQPLILLFLAPKYLKNFEKITLKLVIFAIMIVTGVIFVSSF